MGNMRSAPAPLAYFGWISEAAALIASDGLWEMKNADQLESFKAPDSLEQWLNEETINP